MNYYLIGVFDNNGRDEKILKPINSTGTKFNKKFKSREDGYKTLIEEIKLFCHLSKIVLKNMLRSKRTIIITETTGRKLFICAIMRFFPNTHTVLRLKGHVFKERRDAFPENLTKKRKIEKQIEKYLDYFSFKKIDLVIPVSKWLSKSIKKELDLSEENIKVINTPQTKDVDKKTDYTYSGKFKILSVTDDSFKQKLEGMNDFLENMKQFLQEKDIQIDIAGNISHSNLKIEVGDIQLLGYVENIERKYKDYDAFIHFSKLDAYPSVVLEALSAEIPTVVNNECGMNEMINDGKNGLKIDLGKPKKMRKKINKIKEDRNLRKKISKNNSKIVNTNNSIEKIGKKFKEAFEQL